MTARTIVKQPSEILDVDVLAGSELAGITVLVVARGSIGVSAAFIATSAISAEGASVRLSGGLDGEEYLVTARGQLADEQMIEDEIDVLVIDGAWTMPDGGVGYVTIADFVETFGLPEVVLMTSAGDGRIDKPMLVNALRYAQGVADLNLSARYAVPIATIPDVVRGAICDIARARLYPRGAPDGVATAAKDAVRTMERIATGAVPLPLPAGSAPAATTSEDPVVFRPGRTRLGCEWGR